MQLDNELVVYVSGNCVGKAAMLLCMALKGVSPKVALYSDSCDDLVYRQR